MKYFLDMEIIVCMLERAQFIYDILCLIGV
jgi:hypothetical protein